VKINRVKIVEINEADFSSDVLGSKQAILVAFLAPWSESCHIISPVLERIARVCIGKLRVVKINADDYPTLAAWYQIRSIPTLLFFVNGKFCIRIIGTASKEAILSKLEPFLPNV
jgi:thioredoxin 1